MHGPILSNGRLALRTDSMNLIRWCIITHFSLMSLLGALLALASERLHGPGFMRSYPSLFHTPFFWIAFLSVHVCIALGLARWQDWGCYLGISICIFEILSVTIIEMFRIGSGRPHVVRLLVYGAELYWFLIPQVRTRFSQGSAVA